MIWATVFSDASYCHRLKVGGWAAWVKIDADPRRHTAHGVLKGPLPNSSFAELYAALNGVWMAARLGAQGILVRTDCVGVISAGTKGGGGGSGMAATWSSAMRRPDMQGLVIRFKHVKGHSGVEGRANYVNDWCDKNARKSMREARASHGRT